MSSNTLRTLRAWLIAISKDDATFYDFIAMLLRRTFIRFQRKYNFYLKSVYFLDNMKGSDVSVLILAGKYPVLWDVTFRRVYEYSYDYDVVVLNAGGFNREKILKLIKEYGFSYLEGYPNNYNALENYYIKYIATSKLIIKLDDDVFVTKHLVKNLLKHYEKLKNEGHDIGFIAPVLNVNNVTYYHFLKTLNLLEQYEQLFEKALITKNWTRQRVWYDPEVAKWLWERSLPLNHIAEIFNERNSGKTDFIPVRFSIQCILFERDFILRSPGIFSLGPKINLSNKNGEQSELNKAPTPPDFLLGDEDTFNHYADILKFGRFVALDAFAGHLSYYPQSDAMIKWFEQHRDQLMGDLNY